MLVTSQYFDELGLSRDTLSSFIAGAATGAGAASDAPRWKQINKLRFLSEKVDPIYICC